MNRHNSADSAPLSARRTFFLYGIIAVWLLATLAGLWWFQQKSVRPFVAATDDARFWQAAQTEALLRPLYGQLPPAQNGQVTLIHFWNPDCLCNQLSQRHFDGLIRGFSTAELRIIVVAPASLSAEQEADFIRLNGERMTLLRDPLNLPLPTSPALALYAPDGRMGYFGAYGFGALCTVANDDFFPNIVRRLAGEGYGPFVNVAGSGCFCAWPVAGKP